MKRILFSIALLLTAAVAVVGVWYLATLEYSVVLAGDPEIIVEYGEVYHDLGAHVQLTNPYFGDIVTELPISASGKVEQGSLGAYTLTYSSRFLWYNASAMRTVRIVDTKAPVISLISGDGFTLPGHEYVEEGFSAQDNYDGDITAKVVRTVQDGTVIYTVSDSSGNMAQMTRMIQYNDPVMPELTLLGDAVVTIKAGTAYIEPGYTASDNADGDITGKVQVSGLPDIYRGGTYTVTYSVADSFGNTTVQTRTVIVEPIRQPQSVVPQGKVIYLTFDDGPSPYTPKLLEVLERYNVKATFFVVKTGYAHLLPQIVEAGHAVGIHTATHRYNEIYASIDAYFNDLHIVERMIYEKTGIQTTLLRFPGGSTNKSSEQYCPGIMPLLRKAVTDMGYQYFDWNVSAGDAGGTRDTNQVFSNVINGIQGKNTAIVLQHDIFDYSVDAVERIIQWGLANGYVFMPLDATSPTCHHG